MARPRPAAMVAAVLLLSLLAPTVQAAAPPKEAHRLVEEEEDRAMAATTTPAAATARGVVASAPSARPPRPSSLPAPGVVQHAQHENALEAVRFDLAVRSFASAWSRYQNSEPSSVRLSVNASFWAAGAAAAVAASGGGGLASSPSSPSQVVHATPGTRAAEPLRVSWSGLDDPKPDDMIAVLLLPSEDAAGGSGGGGSGGGNGSFPPAAAPAKFALLGAAAAPSGSLELRLANYLSPYVALALFRGGPASPELASRPLVLRNAADARAPVQRRLSLAAAAAAAAAPFPSSSSPSSSSSSAGGDGGAAATVALAVRWTTRADGGNPGVWWTDEPPLADDESGVGGGNRGRRRPARPYKHFAAAEGPALTYAREDMCGGDARGVGYAPPGYFHTAVMRGLVPGRRYWYVVGDAGGGGAGGEGEGSPPPPPPPPEEAVRSPEAAFLAPPGPGGAAPAGSPSRVRVLLTADMGQAEPDGWSQALDYTNEASVRTARALAAEVEGGGGGAKQRPETNAAAAAAAAADDNDDDGAPPAPPVSLVLHAGDVSYARGYAALWSAFHDLVEPVASAVPYMLCPGNHERDWPLSGDRFSAETGEAGARAAPPSPSAADGRERREAARWRAARGDMPARDTYDSGGECGVAFARRFAMPAGGSILSSAAEAEAEAELAAAASAPQQDKPWFAFDHGPDVRFVLFSTEHDFMPGSEQHAFLERAFAGARPAMRAEEGGGGSGARAAGNATAVATSSTTSSPSSSTSAPSDSRRPWLVLVGHRPLHVCSSWDGYADSDGAVSRALRAALDPLLARYSVDLTVSGHHHSYGRSCAVVPSSSADGAGDDDLGPSCAPPPEGGNGNSNGGGGNGGGVVHVVAGNGGAPLSLNPTFPPSAIWQRLRYDWGYLRLDATASRLRVESVTPGGEVVDAFVLRR